MWTQCKKWWGSATRLESRLVTWCMWTNGRIGWNFNHLEGNFDFWDKYILRNSGKPDYLAGKSTLFQAVQSRKGCFALFLEKHAACNGCFILMHCHCQILCVHVALQKFIYFREIFEWAYTDGMTTFINVVVLSAGSHFWPISFYYYTVWCLLSLNLCHLKCKLFKSRMMPVEVLISIVKDWYKWLVSGLVHLLSNNQFKRTGLMPCSKWQTSRDKKTRNPSQCRRNLRSRDTSQVAELYRFISINQSETTLLAFRLFVTCAHRMCGFVPSTTHGCQLDTASATECLQRVRIFFIKPFKNGSYM